MFHPFGAKALPEVTPEDLQGLIDSSIEEGLFVEYKGQWDGFKISRAIASFANSHGGTLVVGVDAPKGIPVTLTPIQNDGELADRIIQTVRSSLDPVPAFVAQVVEFKDSRACIVVEIPEGTQPPYVHIGKGQLFVRAGSMSEPVPANDRESIDRLFAKGQRGLDWARARLAAIPSELAFETMATGWEEVHVVSVPAVEDGLFAGTKIFTHAFSADVASHVSASLAVLHSGSEPETLMLGQALTLEWEAATGGMVSLRVETTGLIRSSWVGGGKGGSGWLDTLLKGVLPIHGRVLVGQLGHQGNVGVAAFWGEGVPGPILVKPVQVAFALPVPVTDLSTVSLREFLDRAVTRSRGYLAYEE
jgi:schlafen family protein